MPEHDAGAGQETTVETALIRETDRAMILKGVAQKRAESCCIRVSATEEIAAPQRPGRNLPFVWERATTMVAVKDITWEEASAPGFETTTRQAWRQAVAEIAEKAKAKLPECSGRVDSAVKIVLAGDVELQADGTARVASQSNGQTVYHVANGVCSCQDFAKAPHSFCKHRV
jgi:hypothetical protein